MRRWLWMITLVGCSSDKPAEAPPPPPKPASKPAPVAPPEPAEATPPSAPGREIEWFIQAVAGDGKHVLLSERGESRKLHYRVVALPSGKIEADVDLPSLSALPRETISDDNPLTKARLDLSASGIAEDLRAIAPLLAPFPLGAGGGIAAAPDGKYVAFNAGDWLYTAVDGQIITRVASQPSYRPKFTPDGKTLLFERIDGTIDGIEGKYELYATSIDGKQPPRKLPGTVALGERFALTDAGTMRAVASYEPKVPTCVVEVGLTAPYPVKKLACLPGHEQLMDCVISPKGTWIGCETNKELPELDPNSTTTLPDGGVVHTHDLGFRVRTMEVATGKVAVTRDYPLLASGISDDGLFVIEVAQGFALVDAHGKQRPLATRDPPSGIYTFFVSPGQLLTESGGKLTVIDATK